MSLVLIFFHVSSVDTTTNKNTGANNVVTKVEDDDKLSTEEIDDDVSFPIDDNLDELLPFDDKNKPSLPKDDLYKPFVLPDDKSDYDLYLSDDENFGTALIRYVSLFL